MGGHIVRPFVGVDKIRRILGDKMLEEGMKIGSRTWVGIFHDHQGTTGVLDKNGRHTVLNAGL